MAELIDAIEHWNDDLKPFVWHQPVQVIIAKVRLGRATLHQIKSATRHWSVRNSPAL